MKPAQFVATAHAVRRLKKRASLPDTMSLAEAWKRMTVQFLAREAEIRACARRNTPFYVGEEAFFFHQLLSAEGEFFLLKSYWDGELRGWNKVKSMIKRPLIRMLNEW